MSSVWERRFPPLNIAGAPSMVVSKPSTQHAAALQSGRSGTPQPMSGGGPDQTLAGRMRPPTRSTTPSMGPARQAIAQTPQQALQAAVIAKHTMLDYSAGGIHPAIATPTVHRNDGATPRTTTTTMSTTVGGQQVFFAGGKQQQRSSPERHRQHHQSQATKFTGSPDSPDRRRSTPLEYNDAITTTADRKTTHFGHDPYQHYNMATGYERMEATFRRVHSRMDHVPLNERWRLMSAWMDRYFLDKDTDALVDVCKDVCDNLSIGLSSSAAMSASLTFGSGGDANNKRYSADTTTRRNTSSSPTISQPGGVRIAASMMLLEQVMHVMARVYPPLYDAVVRIRDDLLSGLYLQTPKEDIDDTFELLRSSTDLDLQQKLIARFYSKTFFQQLRDERRAKNRNVEEFAQASSQRANQMKVMNRTVAHWQHYTQQRLFLAWRGTIRREKKDRALAKTNEGMSRQMEVLSQLLEAKEDEMRTQRSTSEDLLLKVRQEVTMLVAQNEALQRTSDGWEKKFTELHDTVMSDQEGKGAGEEEGESAAGAGGAMKGGGGFAAVERKMLQDLTKLRSALQQVTEKYNKVVNELEVSEEKNNALQKKVDELRVTEHSALLCFPKAEAASLQRLRVDPGLGGASGKAISDDGSSVSMHAALLEWASTVACTLNPELSLVEERAAVDEGGGTERQQHLGSGYVRCVRRHILLYASALEVKVDFTPVGMNTTNPLSPESGTRNGNNCHGNPPVGGLTFSLETTATAVFKVFDRLPALKGIFSSPVDLAARFDSGMLNQSDLTAAAGGGSSSNDMLSAGDFGLTMSHIQGSKHLMALFTLHQHRHRLLSSKLKPTTSLPSSSSSDVELDGRIVQHDDSQQRMLSLVFRELLMLGAES